MPNVQHATLTGAELHEPKGVSGASINDTYVADGAGSGAWAEPEPKGASGAATGTTYISDGAGSGAWTVLYQHGELNVIETDALSVGTIGTTPLTFPFNNDGSSAGGVIPANASNQITVTDAGTYMVDFICSFTISAAGDAGDYEFKTRVGGVNEGPATKITASSAATYITAHMRGLMPLTAAEVISISIESDEAGNTDDIDVHSATLQVVKVT